MKNYRRLGNYIQELKVRNTDQKVEQLLGINIDKFFMPSVANVIGTDLSVYKIVKNNQFACNRMHVGRDYRLPISMSKTDEAFIVSPAYDVFEIKDTTELLPEYLMMWFTRAEFDRNAWFYTDADVRGGLAWQAFEDMQLPIPHPDKQREIVKEYNVIQNRISLNQQLIQKLEETAQAIYKQWFVEFEFPDENGKPYKSNGGEMVLCEELRREIPKGWEVVFLDTVCEKLYGYPFDSNLFTNQSKYNIPLIRIRDILNGYSEVFTSENVDSKYILENGDLLIGMDGTFHMSIWFSGKAYLNQRVVRLKPLLNDLSNLQVLYSIRQQMLDFENNIQGTTVAHLSDKHIKEVFFLVGDKRVQKVITPLFSKITKYIITIKQENKKLTELKELLLSKLATIEK